MANVQEEEIETDVEETGTEGSEEGEMESEKKSDDKTEKLKNEMKEKIRKITQIEQLNFSIKLLNYENKKEEIDIIKEYIKQAIEYISTGEFKTEEKEEKPVLMGKNTKVRKTKKVETVEGVNGQKCEGSCAKWKPLDDFGIHTVRKDGSINHRNKCKKCCSEEQKEKRKQSS